MALNDVVRHVILRILVDQAGLAEELAAARAKLKALKDSEGEFSKARAKSADSVTDAYKKQNKALGENSAAQDANRRARSTTADATSAVKNDTAAINENTEATKRQTVEEAKAEAIRRKARQDELDAQQKRRERRRQDSDSAEQDAGKAEQKRQAAERKTFQQREQATDQHEQKLANTQQKFQDQREQSKSAADQKRAEAAQRSDQDAVTRQRDADRRDNQSTQNFLSNEARKQAAAAETERRKNEESQARVETSQARTFGVDTKNADTSSILDSTREVREQAVTDKATSQSTVAQSNASASQSREAAAASREAVAEEQRLTAETSRQNRALTEQETLRQRRVATTRQTKALENDITRASQQGELLEQRIAAAAEARARAAEREAKSKQSKQTVIGSIGSVVSDVAVGVGRSVLSAPKASARRAATTAANTTEFDEIERKATTVTGRVEKLFGDLGKRISRSVGDGAEDAASKLGKITQQVRGYIDSVNRPRQGGSGNSLFSDLISNFNTMGNKLTGVLQNGTSHLISFQSLIVAVIAALGPLAAILGAVGAAALALASNIGALAGGFAALPGLIGAAIAGFGALAIVMKPLSNIFSAYSAAQKEATQTTNAARDAANDYKIALDNQQQAYIDYKRAQADAPRAEQALKDARKDATRQLEDYTTALKKLRFEQEGASLDVESAEQQARRAMADPTASSLDRREALHNVQGALFDQSDQATQAKRTREDASEAFAKGVDGADEVVQANRNVEDSARKIDLAYLQWQKDITATQKAQRDAAAGGSAAATLAADLAKLPPQTRKVTQAILDLMNGPYKKMRDQLSENIFGPISGETGKFADLLDELSTFLQPASVAIGRFAQNALDLFTNPDWKAFFAAQGEKSGDIIAKLGDAALAAANGFKAIVEVARPFTDFVVDGIVGMAKGFDSVFNDKNSKGREDLVWFLSITQKRMSELWPVIKNFAAGIGGFFKALNQPTGGKDDFTTWFNKGLLNASANFKKLGEQAQDPNGGFQKWLKNVKPLLHDVVGFISSAAGFIGKLFSDNRNMSEASSLLKAISTQWLPKLDDIFGKLSSSGLVSKLGAAIGGIFEGLNKFFDHGGTTALSIFGSTLEWAGGLLSKIASVVEWIGKNVPFATDAFKVLGGAIALIFGAALVAKISGFTALITNLIKAAKGIGNIAGSIGDTGGETRPGRAKSYLQGKVDSAKDKALLRPSGTSAERRNLRKDTKKAKKAGSTGRSGSARPTVSPTGHDGATSGVLPYLSRMEVLLKEIAINTGRISRGGTGGSGGTGGGDDKPRPGGPGGGGGARPGDNTTSNRRSRTTQIPKRPTSRLDPIDFGPTSLDEGIDPNSAEGKAARTKAAKEARTRRVVRGSTPLGKLESQVADELGTAVPTPVSTPTPAKQSRVRRVTKSFGRGLSALGGALYPTPATQPILGPVEGPELGTHDTSQGSRTFEPYDISQVPAQRTYPQGLPDYATSYSTVPDNYKAPTRTGKKQTIPGLQDSYTVPLPPQQRDARGKVLPRNTPLPTGTFDDYTVARPPAASEAYNVYEPTADPYKAPTRTGKTQVIPGLQDRYTVAKPAQQRGPGGRMAATAPIKHPFRPLDLPEYKPASVATPSRATRVRKGLLGGLGAVGRAVGAPFLSGGNDLGAIGTGSLLSGRTATGSGGLGDEAEYEEGYVSGYDAALGQAGGGQQLSGLPDRDKEKKPGKKARRGLSSVEDELDDVGKSSGKKGSLLSRVFSRGKGGKAAGLADAALSEGEDVLDDVAGSKGGKGGSLLSRIFRGGKAGKAAGVAEEGIEDVAKLGGSKLGLVGRLGGGLARGAVGGIGGIVAGAAASLGGDYLINKFVKSDKDKGSLQRGLGAVAQGAGIGATIGSVIPGVGTVVGGAVGGAIGGVYSLFKDKNLRDFVEKKLANIGSLIADGFKGALSGIADFVKFLGSKIGGFFSSLGGLALKAGKAVLHGFEDFLKFWFVTLPATVLKFLFVTLPGYALKGVEFLLKAYLAFLKFWYIDLPLKVLGFFTKTLPGLALQGWKWLKSTLLDPFINWIEEIPGFFTKTIPGWFSSVGTWFGKHVKDPITDFFTKTIPGFFTDKLPAAFGKIGTFLKNALITPFTNFFAAMGKHEFVYWLSHPGEILSNLKTAFIDRKMSGGLIQGVFQGVEDKALSWVTPGEMVIRRSKVEEPGAKMFLQDFNERGMESLYKGLSAATAPQVMSMVSPDAQELTGRVPTVVNNTVNHAPVMGDVTINNPVREKSEATLRRQIHIAAIRHRR
jgi:hypothetical protein